MVLDWKTTLLPEHRLWVPGSAAMADVVPPSIIRAAKIAVATVFLFPQLSSLNRYGYQPEGNILWNVYRDGERTISG